MERKKSKMPTIGIPNGCMGGLFHFIGFNQHLHIKKILAHNKKGSDLKQIERSKSPKEKQDVSMSEGHEFVDTDANTAKAPWSQVEDEGSISRNNSSKVLARGLNSKRRHSSSLSSISSPSVQLLRTLSIHHLESNDYAENSAINIEKLPVVHNSDDRGSAGGHALLQSPSKPRGTLHTVDYVGQTKLNKVPDHLAEKHSLLREKLQNAKEAMSKKKGTDAKELEQDAAAFHQSKEFMDMMLLLNNNRELLLKILKDPSSFLSFLESQRSSSAERVLDRTGSFPVSGLPRRQNGEMMRLKHKPQRSELPAYRKEDLSVKPNANEDGVASLESNASIPNLDSGSTDSARISSCFFERSDVISSSCEPKEQRESQWDNRATSAHFKVIKKRIKDVIRDDRKGSNKIFMDGVLHKIPYGSKVSNDTNKEKQQQQQQQQRLLDRPATTMYSRDDSRGKSIKRSHSLNESLAKYSRLFESIPSREFKRTPERPKMKEKDGGGGLKGAMPTKTLGRIFSLPDLGSDSLKKDVKCRVFGAVRSLKIPTTVDTCNVQVLDYTKGLSSHESIHSSFQEEDFIDEEEETSDWLIKTSASDWLTKTSAISDLELYFPENPAIPAEVSATETLEQSLLDIYGSDELEGSKSDSEGLELRSELDDYYSFFSVQVDHQNETQFKFVRDILWKSGFSSNEFLRAWYSPDQPVDPFLFEETICTLNADPETYLENLLLFDLVNEVLLDIYDTSSSCCPWLAHLCTHTRPLPEGHRVLEEVWAKISWHLNSQTQLDPMLDYDVARDFEKNDGWMELQYDCEDVGLELEDLILDDLVDEVVFELESVSGLQHAHLQS